MNGQWVGLHENQFQPQVLYYLTIVEVGDFTIESDGKECTTSGNSRLDVGNGEVKTFTLSGCRGRVPTGLTLCRVKVYGTCTGKWYDTIIIVKIKSNMQ